MTQEWQYVKDEDTLLGVGESVVKARSSQSKLSVIRQECFAKSNTLEALQSPGLLEDIFPLLRYVKVDMLEASGCQVKKVKRHHMSSLNSLRRQAVPAL